MTEGEQASIVVLNRHSGEILALTSTYQQDFDLGSTLTDEMLAAYNNSGEPVWTPDVGLAMLTQGVIDNELFRPHVTKAVCYSDNSNTLQISEKTEEERIAGDMLSDETCSRVRSLMETAADSYGMSDHVSGAKTGTAEMEIDGAETGRANMAAYDETYIVVVSKNGSDFGISNKDVIEKLFNKLDDIR